MLNHSTAMLVASNPLYAGMSLCMPINRRRDYHAEMFGVLSDDELLFVRFFCSAEYFLTTFVGILNETFISLAVADCTTVGEITPDGYGCSCFISINLDYRNRERGWVLELNALLVPKEYDHLVSLPALKTVTRVSGVGSPHQNFSTFNGLANLSRSPTFPDCVSIRRECL